MRLTLLNLSTEILSQIFKHLKTEPTTIKSLRLVCRRFCEIGSELLVPVLSFRFNKESLRRITEISDHASIRKSVREIKFILAFYNRSLTTIEGFVSFYGQCLFSRSGPRKLRSLAEKQEGPEWCHVKDIHRQYLELLKLQDAFIQSPATYQELGSAIANMPHATNLVFCNSFFRSGPDVLPPNEWDKFSCYMLQPLSAGDMWRGNLPHPSYQCVIDVINAVLATAGTSFYDLTFQLCSLGRPADMAAPGLRPVPLSQKLRKVSFDYGHISQDGQNGQDARDIRQFLSVCLEIPNLESLESLSINMDVNRKAQPLLLLWKLTPRGSSFPKLTSISVTYVTLKYDDLIAFLNRLSTPMVNLSMQWVNLVGGSWEATLDALREKEPQAASVSYPCGVECNVMDETDRLFIFEEGDDIASQAQAYISRASSENPIATWRLRGGL